MKRFIFAVLGFFLIGAATAFANVEATGEGPSREQALVSAMRRAVEEGVGTFIKSETTVESAQLIEDKILSHSSGYVTSYKIIGEEKTDDGYSVTISAKVDTKTLQDDIDALAILRKNVGNPRILVLFSNKGEGAEELRDKDFVDEIYNGIVESLTDRQFRVVDKATSERFAIQVAQTHEIDVNLNEAAVYGLRYNAEYTLLYSVSGVIKQGAVGTTVKLRIKAQLIDNTRSLVITSKVVQSTSSGQSVENALEKAARVGGKKVVGPMIPVIQKNWMDMQQNGHPYILVIDGMDDPEDIARFTDMLEKFPLVNEAKEMASGGGKATFEAVYKGKRDQLDRDVLRATKELGWSMEKIRAEGSRSTWKKQ